MAARILAREAKLGERETRRSRAQELLERGAFERIQRGSRKSPETWLIETPTGSVYTMEWDRQTCECEDYRRHWHLTGFRCKHLLALAMKRDWFKRNARELAPYFDEEAEVV